MAAQIKYSMTRDVGGYHISKEIYNTEYDEDDHLYLHHDGTWHDSLKDEADKFHYYESRAQAIQACKTFNIDVGYTERDLT